MTILSRCNEYHGTFYTSATHISILCFLYSDVFSCYVVFNWVLCTTLDVIFNPWLQIQFSFIHSKSEITRNNWACSRYEWWFVTYIVGSKYSKYLTKLIRNHSLEGRRCRPTSLAKNRRKRFMFMLAQMRKQCFNNIFVHWEDEG